MYMTREEYKVDLTNELRSKDARELTAYARERKIRLFTKVPSRMISTIVEAMTVREFHGDAFRGKGDQS